MGGVHRPKDGTAGEGRAERLNKYERKVLKGSAKISLGVPTEDNLQNIKFTYFYSTSIKYLNIIWGCPLPLNYLEFQNWI
jgi:hypothetical protein